MGATLPAIARWVETTPKGVSWLGYFYGGNLAGAVAGSLLAGLLPAARLRHADGDFAAVALNVVVALLALVIAARTPHTVITPTPSDAERRRPFQPTCARLVYVAIALSGLTALGREVVWTRMLSLLFGATTYTFSLILAVFLVGLGIGSSLGAAMARNLSNPRIALGWCQVGLCACAGLGGVRDGASLPYWPINPSISTSLDVQLPARSDARDLGDAARRDPLGRELPAGAGRVAARGRTRHGWSAASTRPTPSARSSARWSTGLVLVGTVGQPDDAAGADRRCGAVGPADADAGGG